MKDVKRNRRNENLAGLYVVDSKTAYKNNKLRKGVLGAVDKTTPFVFKPKDVKNNKPRKSYLYFQKLKTKLASINCKDNGVIKFRNGNDIVEVKSRKATIYDYPNDINKYPFNYTCTVVDKDGYVKSCRSSYISSYNAMLRAYQDMKLTPYYANGYKSISKSVKNARKNKKNGGKKNVYLQEKI